jgi:hypothetical protein
MEDVPRICGHGESVARQFPGREAGEATGSSNLEKLLLARSTGTANAFDRAG